MNRAERRKRAKLGLPVTNEPVYNIKQSDFNRQKEKAKSEAVDTAMVLLFAIPIKVMREYFGWGNEITVAETGRSTHRRVSEVRRWRNDVGGILRVRLRNCRN